MVYDSWICLTIWHFLHSVIFELKNPNSFLVNARSQCKVFACFLYFHLSAEMLEIFVVNLECILSVCLFKQLVVGEERPRRGGGGGGCCWSVLRWNTLSMDLQVLMWSHLIVNSVVITDLSNPNTSNNPNQPFGFNLLVNIRADFDCFYLHRLFQCWWY